MLFSHWLFLLKNWHSSTNSSKGFIVSLNIYQSFLLDLTLRKIPKFQLISWCGNYAEVVPFLKISTAGN